MGSLAYVSRVQVQRVAGPLQQATLPGEAAAVTYGVHGALARLQGVDLAATEPHAGTLDHVVAAAGGSLAGAFQDALEARGVTLQPGDLTAEIEGEIERDARGVLMIKRIRARYSLHVAKHQQGIVDRALAVHVDACSVARTLRGCVAVGTSVVYR